MNDKTQPEALAQECADYATSLRSTIMLTKIESNGTPASMVRAAELFERAATALQAALPAQAQEAPSITIDFKQGTELLEMFGGRPTEYTLEYWPDGHSGAGLYAHVTEYPEDGAYFLGISDASAIPATPAQEDARDAERYRWLAPRLMAADFDWNETGTPVLVFEWPKNVAVGGSCDQNIDAARAAQGGAA